MTFAPNLLLKSRWKILSKIGQGAFGETYIAEDIETRMKVCVKMESTDKKKQMLKAEAAILKSLQGQPHVCQFYGCGRHQGYNFIVMELLGHNLSQFRRVQPKNQFPVSVTAALAIEMLGAIEVLHENGYLHRDIKPSNFALGIDPVANGIPKVYVIDFGLSRRYRSKDGSVKEPRNYAGFRGTARYASLNSHHSKELSRKDDLWSLFYLLVEFLTGNLPWKKEKERDQIGKLKEEFTQPSLVQGLPPQMLSMLHHINQLTYRETPNYSLLRDLFQQMLQQTKENPVPFFRSASLQIPLPYSKFLSNIPAGLTEETVSAEVPLLSGPNQKDHSEESFEQLTDDMNDPRRPAAPSAHHPAPMGKLSIDNILIKSEPSHFLPWAPTASGSSSIVLPPIFFLQGFTTTSQPGFSLPQNATSTRTSSTVSASSTAFSPSANDQQQSQMLSSSSAEGMPPIFYQQLLPHYQHLQASHFHPYYQPKPTFQPQQQQPPQIALQQQQFFLYQQQQQQQQQQQYMQQQFLPPYQQYQQQQQQQQHQQHQQHRQEEFMKQQLLLQQQQLLLQAQQEQRNAAACANSLPVSSPSDSSAKRRRSPTKGGQSRTQTAVYSSRNNSEEERGFSSLIEGDQPLAAVAAAHPKKKRARLLLSEGEHDDPTEKEKHCSSDDNHASLKGAPPQLSFLASRRALPLAPSEKPVYS